MPTGRLLDIPIILVDPEFQALLPIMVKEEKDALEASILAEGCREPLIVWGDLLIDGHRRYDICKAHDLDFMIVKKEFPSREAAKIWIISNQFARRNLTPKQISYLRGMRQKIERGETVGSSEKLAKEYGVSSKTIERDAEFAEKVNQLPPEEKDDILAGKKKVTKGKVTGKNTTAKTPTDHLRRWWKKASHDEKEEFLVWANHDILNPEE